MKTEDQAVIVLTRCECCGEIRDDVLNTKRYGAQTAADAFDVIGYFDLCTDCAEDCPSGISWCKRGRCAECGVRQSWAEDGLGSWCAPCASVSWAFGRGAMKPYHSFGFDDALRASVEAIYERRRR
jgi:hypothetical protein